MKKLLMVLCVAAFGIGATAQAQVAQHDGATRKDLNETKVTDLTSPPVMGFSAGQLKANDAPYDTLRWHDEYQNEDCQIGYYTTYYSRNGMFADASCPGVFSAYLSGTGEVGATYQTNDNVYENYAGISVQNAWVVGAYAVVYRMGSTQGWERVGMPEGTDPERVNYELAVPVPDMPFKLVGYPHVAWQQAYESYNAMFYDREEGDLIEIEMPLSYKDRVETTETLYVRYNPYMDDNGNTRAALYGLGGMFNEVFPARENFGLSLDAELTGDMTYDSLWNFSLGAKSNSECVFIDDWSVWQRWDFSNHEKSFVWLYNNDNTDMDVSLPWNVTDTNAKSGLAPDNCPQYDNDQSLFVYGHTLLLLQEGSHYKPGLYPIIQDAASIERNRDAYAQTVSVYPLPATDKVNVVALDPIRRVEIYNMAGTLIEAIEMNDNVLDLNVTSYAPGAYVAKIKTEKGVASKKLLVK